MTIKHLVIAGGGPLGFQYLGAIKALEEQSFWKIDDIESIYGTSVGSIIGAFLCLKYDWETLFTYIIERPWHEAIKVNARQIIDSFYNKGLLDKKIAEIIFKPLLEAKNLNIGITLKELYQFSKIKLHIFSFDVNTFQTVEFTHLTHPELSLLEAITMSSALPGLVMPTIMNNACYMDGGIMCNFPIDKCLRDHDNKDEILAVTSTFEMNIDSMENAIVSEDSSLLEYIIAFFVNTINYLYKFNNTKKEMIKNTIMCAFDQNPLNLELFKTLIHSKEKRKELIERGEMDAIQFLQLSSTIAD